MLGDVPATVLGYFLSHSRLPRSPTLAADTNTITLRIADHSLRCYSGGSESSYHPPLDELKRQVHDQPLIGRRGDEVGAEVVSITRLRARAERENITRN
jgi:hypothetical protein